MDNVVLDTSGYHIGDQVQIIGGELTGVKGILVAEGNHNYKIELEYLGMGLMINVDPQNLLKIGSPKRIAVSM